MNRIKLCSIVFMVAFSSFLYSPSVTLAQVILTDEEARIVGHELSIAKTSIQNSKEQLRTAKQRLMELSEDLEVSKKNLIVQNVQLQSANKSLELQAKEFKKQIHKVSRERNFAIAIAGCFAVIAFRK